MSCDAVASAAFLVLTALSPAGQGEALRAPAIAAAPAGNPLAREPLFADIVGRARALKADAERLRTASDKGAAPLNRVAGFDAFQRQVAALAELDMKGHLELAARGTDGDLKCILRGIAQDLPLKLKDLVGAKDTAARDLALREMAYLLNDNVEVIEAPPAPPV